MFTKELKHMLVTIGLLISVITFLFFLVMANDKFDHDHILHDFVEIKNINNKLDKDILLVRSGLLRHYNSLDNGFVEINKTYANLNEHFTNIIDIEEIRYYLKSLRKNINEKEDITNTLKSDIGVLRNSLMYISTMSKNINYNSTNHDSDISTELFKLNRHILKILRNPSSLDKKELSKDINTFSLKVTRIKNKTLHNKLSLITKHLQIILRNSVSVKKSFRVVLKKDISNIVDNIQNAYLNAYIENKKTINIYQALIYISVVILFFYSFRLILSVAVTSNKLRNIAFQLGHQKNALDEHAIVAITDKNGIIEEVNQYFCLTFHIKEKDVIGKQHFLINPLNKVDPLINSIYERIKTGHIWRGETNTKSKSGNEIWLNQTIVPFINENGNIYQYVSIATDVSGQKFAENKIKHQAFHDTLTHLPNRRLMVSQLEHAISSNQKHKLIGSFMFIDLDRFKSINDSLGHNIGDSLLINVAERLSYCVGERGHVARFGGDEFVILFPDIASSIDEAKNEVEKIANKILLEISYDYKIANHSFSTTCSIGITLISSVDTEVNTILKQTDIALYKAKKAGKNCFKIYDSTMQEAEENRRLIESDLHHALRNKEFKLYLQPQYDSKHNIIGAETLLRWEHSKRGLISPGDFIPIAEETGVIIQIGEWVFEQIFYQVKKWMDEKNTISKYHRIAINVSPLQFMQPNFVDTVIKLINKTQVPPEKIEFEITEGMLLENIEETIKKMNKIRSTGIVFSVDDFGTGYSSLAYLNKLPISKLKIDQAFVRDININKNNETIVQTIIYMAKNLGMDVIAEGVETEEELNCLKQLGCNSYQGFYFNKPLPLEDFQKL